jgi:hypothetical protein
VCEIGAMQVVLQFPTLIVLSSLGLLVCVRTQERKNYIRYSRPRDLEAVFQHREAVVSVAAEKPDRV